MALKFCKNFMAFYPVRMASTITRIPSRMGHWHLPSALIPHRTQTYALDISYGGKIQRDLHLACPENAGSAYEQSHSEEGQAVQRVSRKDMLAQCIDGLFSSSVSLSFSEWEGFGHRLRDIIRANEQWPSQMMKIFSGQFATYDIDHIYELATSLLNYVRHSDSVENHAKPRTSVALLVSYMCICGNYHTQDGHTSTEIEAAIKQVYDEIKVMTEVLDGQSSIDIIQGLSSTNSHWELCLPILEDVKLFGRPGTLHYSPLVSAAFRNGRSELAWKLLEEMAGTFYDEAGYLTPNDEIYTSFLLNKVPGENESLNSLLEFMQKHRWIPSERIVNKFIEYYEKEGWHGKVTKISDDGSCPSCQEKLSSEYLTKAKFTELRTAFLDKCLRREDVFLNTSPTELKKFHAFLEKNHPFDIVLDGLNIGLQLSKGKGFRKASDQLLKIAQLLSGHGNLLVCGRNHMKKWRSSDMRRLEKIATVFYAEDISSDDPFMIYAALHSGDNTKIVTLDMLRDHRFLLQPELRERFQTWQRTHQITFAFRQKLQLTWPKQFDTRVHRTDKSIHIPFEDNIERASYELPNSWLCLTKA